MPIIRFTTSKSALPVKTQTVSILGVMCDHHVRFGYFSSERTLKNVCTAVHSMTFERNQKTLRSFVFTHRSECLRIVRLQHTRECAVCTVYEYELQINSQIFDHKFDFIETLHNEFDNAIAARTYDAKLTLHYLCEVIDGKMNLNSPYFSPTFLCCRSSTLPVPSSS